MAPVVWPDGMGIPQSFRRTRSVAHCGPDRIQSAKSLEVPLWMLESASCSALRVAEHPAVDCAALQQLKTLLFVGVLEDRHSSVGGADADQKDSAPTVPAGIVLSPVGGDPLAQVAARD